MSRSTKIHIDLAAIAHNAGLVKALAPDTKIVAMVKADAYGHGAADVSLALEQHVDRLGVCCLQEALQLRTAGVQLPIVLIEGCFSAQECMQALQANCELVIHSELQLAQLKALNLRQQITIWLKIDTGMHRLGLSAQDLVKVYGELKDAAWVEKVILVSHFANADNLASDSTVLQLNVFGQMLGSLQASDKIKAISLANSAGIMAWPQSHHDWVRPGIMLYGISPFAQPHAAAQKLVAAMTFTSKVIALRSVELGETVGYGSTWTASRRSIIATIAVGYGDGYPRTAASGTPILVNGQRCQLVGRVSMDMICADVSDISSVKVDDPVELWGKILSVNEVAEHAGTVGYELVTRMTSRPTRLFVNTNQH